MKDPAVDHEVREGHERVIGIHMHSDKHSNIGHPLHKADILSIQLQKSQKNSKKITYMKEAEHDLSLLQDIQEGLAGH